MAAGLGAVMTEIVIMCLAMAYGTAVACRHLPELAYIVLIIAPLAALQSWFY
jgi:hypothetical protein